MSTVSGQPPSKAGTPWRKRKRAPDANSLTYDELLAKELRDADHKLKVSNQPQAEKVIHLGYQIHTSLKPNLLGPSLKRRFWGGRG